MPVLRSIRERFARERPLDGVRVAACLHVTAETAVLVRTLAAGGASVALAAANPLSTQDDVAEALGGVADVHGRRGDDAAAYAKGIAALAKGGQQIALDDGADLIAATHDGLTGGIEETTTGLVRLRALNERGEDETIYLARLTNLVRSGHSPASLLIENWKGRWNDDVGRMVAGSSYEAEAAF